MLVKNKRSVTIVLDEWRREIYDGIYFGYLLFHFCFWFIRLREEDKKIEQNVSKVEWKQVKGNKEMSRLLEELKGQTVSIRLNGFGSNWEIVDFDEDWVKLSVRVLNNIGWQN